MFPVKQLHCSSRSLYEKRLSVNYSKGFIFHICQKYKTDYDFLLLS